MHIRYSSSMENITKDALEELFLSVKWESGKYPKDLYKAIKGSHSIVTAWDGDKLIGLINALSDGAITVYFHYVLTNPDYQGKGIGKEMMEMMLENYKTYQTKVLIALPNVVDFYTKLGFKVEDNNAPMYISDLI